MERVERNHEALARDVNALAGTVQRVELNQKHAEELTKLRFDALDNGIRTVDKTLERFMDRINAIVSGEVKLPQAEQGEKLVADYLGWRDTVEKRLDSGAVFEAQGKLIGRIAMILLTSNVIAIVSAVLAVIHH